MVALKTARSKDFGDTSERTRAIAMEALVRHVTALKQYMAASPMLDRGKWLEDLQSKVKELPYGLSLLDATKLANLLDFCSESEKAELVEHLHAKVFLGSGSSSTLGKNRSLQNWKSLAKVLHEKHWDLITDKTVPRPGLCVYFIGLEF